MTIRAEQLSAVITEWYKGLNSDEKEYVDELAQQISDSMKMRIGKRPDGGRNTGIGRIGAIELLGKLYFHECDKEAILEGIYDNELRTAFTP